MWFAFLRLCRLSSPVHLFCCFLISCCSFSKIRFHRFRSSSLKCFLTVFTSFDDILQLTFLFSMSGTYGASAILSLTVVIHRYLTLLSLILQNLYCYFHSFFSNILIFDKFASGTHSFNAILLKFLLIKAFMLSASYTVLTIRMIHNNSVF